MMIESPPWGGVGGSDAPAEMLHDLRGDGEAQSAALAGVYV
jgi:hypothetical protein